MKSTRPMKSTKPTKADEVDKADEADEVDEANEADKVNEPTALDEAVVSIEMPLLLPFSLTKYSAIFLGVKGSFEVNNNQILGFEAAV